MHKHKRTTVVDDAAKKLIIELAKQYQNLCSHKKQLDEYPHLYIAAAVRAGDLPAQDMPTRAQMQIHAVASAVTEHMLRHTETAVMELVRAANHAEWFNAESNKNGWYLEAD